VHAGKKMGKLYKTKHLISEAKISLFHAKLSFISNDLFHAVMVQPQSPLLLPFLILVHERRGFENRQNTKDLPRVRLAHHHAVIVHTSI
jgi:hypothetical protein